MQCLRNCGHRLKLSTSLRSFRSIWTGVTWQGPAIQECVKTCLESGHVQPRPVAAVALVSKSFTPQEYAHLIQQVQNQLAPELFLGCVVDRVARVEHGVSLWMAYDEDVQGFFIQDGPERHKVRNISVGRWGRVEDYPSVQHQRTKFGQAGWDAFDSVSQPAQQYLLPESLTAKQTSPSFIFVASDNEPDELLQSFDHHYPTTPKIGIIGASTPFLTGQPYTLFYQGKAMGAGIVGLASYRKDNPSLTVIHHGLEKMGEPLKITRCRGNVILDLDQAGATGLLLDLLHSGPSGKPKKDEEFYLGVYPAGDTQLDDAKLSVNRVTSGDPSRGNMSVDTTADFEVGQTVQFMRKVPCDPQSVLEATEGKVVVGVVDKDATIDALPIKKSSEHQMIANVFGATSENGAIVGRPSLPTQILDVPYSQISFKA
ncbi:uncharacterized protein BYT42DRAFT_560686 [Radiomyces spectabilis]|uniref:uncharacterized protein n=1 Tax=Radiomyces spectabilis TaxID=64574 RepID=UPI00222060E0|nr:uncharacterized protein BYT42DRAFT_560686 [Radiomyces spectabilis]KAI8388614.1 hypothetical protein BYT42DRAFT_560686 [Radiomyces spectabilis]